MLMLAAACGGSSVFTTTSAPPATTGSTTTTSGVTSTTFAGTPSTTVGQTTSTRSPTTTSSSSSTTTSSTSTTLPWTGNGVVAGNICLLGWSHPGGWVDEFDAADVPAGAGDHYQTVLLDGPVGIAVGGPAEAFCEPLDLVNIPLDPSIAGPFGDVHAVAVGGNWELRPQEVTSLALGLPAYVDATAELLTSHGIADPDVQIRRVLRADLEGDGIDEVFIVAANVGVADPADVGDYAVVFMRKLIAGEVQTALLAHWFVTEPFPEDWIPFIDNYDIAAIADLNGDGRMEIVVQGNYYEGAFLSVFEYVDDDLGPVQVLGCGCGV